MRNLLGAAMLVAAAGAAAAWALTGTGGAAAPMPTPHPAASLAQRLAQGQSAADAPRTLPDLAFIDASGARRQLSDFRGRVVLLNLWATWCHPCVSEMPALDHLQARLGGSSFQVVAISQDRNGRSVVAPFFADQHIANLPMYLDPQNTAMEALHLRGLPTTMLIDRDGREVGRMEGAAAWDSGEALRLIERLIGNQDHRQAPGPAAGVMPTSG